MKASARACSNLALVKYWGKRDERLVLPFTGSLSVTLDALWTDTRVEFTGAGGTDEVMLDGTAAGERERGRISGFLALLRAEAPGLGAARVESRSNFPAASGLASSASGFAALAAAASWAAGRAPSPEALSVLARRGSGSACRSIFGGFVEWVRGERPDGADSHARQVLGPDAWDVAVVVAQVRAGPKARSSRDAMRDAVRTSPYFDAWVRATGKDLDEARRAVLARDLERLGAVAERSFLRMHATALTAEPASIFWLPATLALLAEVAALRDGGIGAWASIDAGPHVAVLCAGPDAPRIAAGLRPVPGVESVRVARPGPGVQRTEWPGDAGGPA